MLGSKVVPDNHAAVVGAHIPRPRTARPGRERSVRSGPFLATHKRSDQGLGAARQATTIASTLARGKKGGELRYLVTQ